MANLNKVMLIGNLTRDPEIKYTPKGTAIAAFGLAVNRNYTTETGEKREEVTFIDLEAFGRVAEIIEEYCHKGDPLYTEGRLKLDQWDDKASGQNRSKLKVIVENIQLLGGRRESSQGGHGAQYDDEARGGARGASTRAPARADRRPATPPRPPADPDLDAAPDDIPF